MLFIASDEIFLTMFGLFSAWRILDELQRHVIRQQSMGEDHDYEQRFWLVLVHWIFVHRVGMFR
jgi:hypothetical protein